MNFVRKCAREGCYNELDQRLNGMGWSEMERKATQRNPLLVFAILLFCFYFRRKSIELARLAPVSWILEGREGE